MAKYIDVDKLVEELKVAFDAIYNDDGRLLYSDHICVGDDVEDLIKRVKGLPTADVAEVRHGKWIRNERNIPKMREFHEKGIGLSMSEMSIFWTCSECGMWGHRIDKYCSECGAKMDRGETK